MVRPRSQQDFFRPLLDFNLRGYSSMVEYNIANVMTRVRFSLAAPHYRSKLCGSIFSYSSMVEQRPLKP